jgi:hypothetical protein
MKKNENIWNKHLDVELVTMYSIDAYIAFVHAQKHVRASWVEESFSIM